MRRPSLKPEPPWEAARLSLRLKPEPPQEAARLDSQA